MVVEVEVKFKELYRDEDRIAMMKEIGERGADLWRSRLFQLKAISSGELLSSISSWNKEDEALVVGAFYGKFIDTGTRPFYPPFMPLYEWAIWKTRDPEEAEKLAHFVQERIAERGVAPKRISEYVLGEIDKELGDVVETKLLKG